MNIQQPTKRKIVLEQIELGAGQQLAIAARPQIQSNWCWAACIEMATAFKGNRIAQCTAANDGFGRQDCCQPVGTSPVNPACNMFGTTGLVVQLCTGTYGYAHTRLVLSALTVGQIANQIQGNHPVYVSIQWFQGGRHMVLIKGWDIAQNNAWVYYNDPANGAHVVLLTTLVAGLGLGTWDESIVDM